MGNYLVTIIGGYGGMGALFAGLFRDEGLRVRITGPDEEKGRRVAGELGVEYMADNKEAAGDADIVMISVPIGKTLDVIEEVAPCVKEGALLMDVTSVKKEPCDAMLRYSGAGVEVIGTHPVFGPRVGVEGQVFFLTPVRAGRWLPWMRKFLKKYDAVIYESTPEEHDRLMAVVQGLTHFIFISAGRTLQRLDFDLRESRRVSSPVYDLMLDIVGRIVGQNPDIYASIQMGNPEILEIHRAFLETGHEISDTVKSGDKEGFIGMMNEVARHFHDLDDAIKRSDREIHSMVSDLNYLRNSVGDEVLLKHIYSGGMHLGVVREVSPQEVVVDESGKHHHLKLSNIEIQGSDEMRQYRKKKFGVMKRDFSVIMDEQVDVELVAELLRDYHDFVTGVDVRDIYRGPQIEKGKKSVCFRIEMIRREEKEVGKEIAGFFQRIGGRLR